LSKKREEKEEKRKLRKLIALLHERMMQFTIRTWRDETKLGNGVYLAFAMFPRIERNISFSFMIVVLKGHAVIHDMMTPSIFRVEYYTKMQSSFTRAVLEIASHYQPVKQRDFNRVDDILTRKFGEELVYPIVAVKVERIEDILALYYIAEGLYRRKLYSQKFKEELRKYM